MNSEIELDSIIKKHPYSASFKEADTGKYILVNDRLARDVGAADPQELVGLTVHDLQSTQTKALSDTAAQIEKLDFLACENKEPAQSRLMFCKSDGGAVLYEEIIKVPVLSRGGKTLGVVTYQRNLTPIMPLNDVYNAYRRFYTAPEAVEHMLNYLDIKHCFSTPPSEAPLRVLLARAERYSNKQIGNLLGISHRTVDYQLDALRDRVIDGDLRHVLALIARSVK